MADNTIALQSRAPRMLSYGELVAGRDQEMSRRNALAIQQQQMQQNAMAQQQALNTRSAMAGAASLANAGEFDAAEKQYGLGAGNLDVHKIIASLQDEHRAMIRARSASAMPVAIQALQEPDMGKRAALVQAAAPMLVQNGWKPEEIAQFQPTDQALHGVINEARTAEEALKLYDKQNELRVLSRGAGLFRGGEKIAEMPIEEKGHITRAADGTIVSIVGNVATPVTMANGPTKHFGPVIEQAALQLNPGTVVSGRGRTPERNAQVGGVANSYHLSDDARDLQPARGQTLDQLAASLAPLKQQGFDVIIERGKNHVHVEPGAGMGRANVGAPLRGYDKPTGGAKSSNGSAGGKSATVQEQNASYNINRVLQAANAIQQVTSKHPSANAPGAAEAVIGSLPLIGRGVNFVRDSDRQIVAAAQRDLLDGLLYLATGAAYNKEQLEGQMESYIPSYSDKPATIKSKRDRLNALISTAKTRAGRAWTPEMDASLRALTSGGGAAPTAGGNDVDAILRKHGVIK